MDFRDLLRDQLEQARTCAAADDLRGDTELGDWWRWRITDLERYLDDYASDT
ncbi:MAG: hypothetical protein ACRDP1_13565 [Nocardioidaceae bacterium]